MEQIITLDRQFGSGGRIIAQNIGKALNIPVYYDEIMDNASKFSGIAIEHFQKSDEKRTGSFLFSLVSNYYSPPMQLDNTITDENLFLQICEAIKRLAVSPCVVVGRCGDDVLKDFKPIRIFVCAQIEDRVKRIAQRFNLTEKNALSLIKKTDKSRSSYYNFYTSKNWGEADNYDICLNTTSLGLDRASNIIINAFK